MDIRKGGFSTEGEARTRNDGRCYEDDKCGEAGMSWKEGMKNTQYVLKDGGKKREGEAGTTVRIL